MSRASVGRHVALGTPSHLEPLDQLMQCELFWVVLGNMVRYIHGDVRRLLTEPLRVLFKLTTASSPL